MAELDLDYDYLAKLVRKTQTGDSNAFAELYTATYQKQYRFTYQYVKDPYLAQDVLALTHIPFFPGNIRPKIIPCFFLSSLL